MKKATFIVLAMAALALSVAPGVFAEEGSKTEGRAAFDEHKCLMCHGVAAQDLKPKAKSEKMLGPDLSGFKSDVEFPKMVAYMRGESAIDGAKHKKPFKGTDEELQAIIDWLGSLEAQE